MLSNCLLSCNVSGRWRQCSGSESWWPFHKSTSPAYTTLVFSLPRSGTRTDHRCCHVTGRSALRLEIKRDRRMMHTCRSRFGWRSECSSPAEKFGAVNNCVKLIIMDKSHCTVLGWNRRSGSDRRSTIANPNPNPKVPFPIWTYQFFLQFLA